MPKSPFDNMPRELNLYMMSFLGTKKNLKNFGETCKYFNKLSKEKSLEKYFEPDFSRPGELQDLQLPIGHHALGLSNDCQTLAAAGKYGPGSLWLVDACTGQLKEKITDYDYAGIKDVNVNVNVTFTPDDKFLIIVWHRPDRYNHSLWSCSNIDRGLSLVDVWKLETLKRVCRFDFNEDQRKLCLPQVHVLNNNEFIITFDQVQNKMNRTLYCNISENECLPLTENIEVIRVESACVSPNKKILAQLLANRGVVLENGQVATYATMNLFNLETGHKIKDIEFDISKCIPIVAAKPSIYFIDDSTVVCTIKNWLHRINVETGKVEQLQITDLPDGLTTIDHSYPIQGQNIALKLPKQTMIWDLETQQVLTTLPYPIDNIIWDDEHKNLIVHGLFDRFEEVKFMPIPHELNDKAEPVAERSSPRP